MKGLIILAKDLVGMKFGRLTVLSRAENYVSASGCTKAQWNCVCDCGNQIVVPTCNLTRGNSKSCGCYNLEQIKARNITHNQKHTRLYGVWTNMKARCYNPNNINYKDYGARGIVLCDEWRDSFNAFSIWAYENGYDPFAKNGECTIDRIDVDGNYCPENCRWANAKEQSNNRTNTYYLTIDNITHSLSEWSDITGIRYHTIFARINKLGWEPKKALGLI